MIPVFTFPLQPLASLMARRQEFEADAFAAQRPVYTSSSDDPRKQIDHVLVSGARASDVTAPRSTASDHLAVAVTLRW